MKINLPVYEIQVTIIEEDSVGGIKCSPDLYEVCPKCNQRDCVFSCDESNIEPVQTDDDVVFRLEANGAVDGVLAVILGHAIAGIDVTTPAYLEGIEAAFDGIANSV